MIRFGFLWDCPWRVERSRHEYWYRWQCGPFYALQSREAAPSRPQESRR